MYLFRHDKVLAKRKYNISIKAPPGLSMKNKALGDVSRDKYSTRLCFVLYLCLDNPLVLYFSDVRWCFNIIIIHKYTAACNAVHDQLSTILSRDDRVFSCRSANRANTSTVSDIAMMQPRHNRPKLTRPIRVAL